MSSLWYLAFVSLVLSSINIQGGSAQHCGIQAGGALCREGFCCSNWGWCGTTDPYCAPGQCQSQCPTPSPPPPPAPAPGGIADLISSEMFDELLPFRNDDRCYAVGFYTYEAFIEAAASFPEFGRTGDNATRKREIAAFLAHTSHETYVPQDWWNPPRGIYYWGYCRVESSHQPATDFYCDRNNPTWPCAPGKQYFGRGPFQLQWNYNYGQCGDALGLDLLNNPDLVSSDPVISFKTAFWFWMTPQDSMPSCHDVMIGAWTPSASDVAAGRLSGFGVTTNIIHGRHECRGGPNPAIQERRIGFYQRYCDELNIETGDNLDCYNQRPFGVGLRNSLYPHIEEVVSGI